MREKIAVSREAQGDILGIWTYLAEKEGVETADSFLDEIEATIQSLETFPDRGHIPPELERISVLNYREIHQLPYRIIFEITHSPIIIHCVLDGRRDIQTLLSERLLRG